MGRKRSGGTDRVLYDSGHCRHEFETRHVLFTTVFDDNFTFVNVCKITIASALNKFYFGAQTGFVFDEVMEKNINFFGLSVSLMSFSVYSITAQLSYNSKNDQCKYK